MNKSSWQSVLLLSLTLSFGCSQGSADDTTKAFDPSGESDAGNAGGKPGGNSGGDGPNGGSTSPSGGSEGGQNVGSDDGKGNGSSGGEDGDDGSGPLIDLDDCEKAPDFDGDKLRGKCDNCVKRENPKQEDSDLDGVGDACDGCDNLSDATCATDINLTLPYGGEIYIIGVPFEVEAAKHALFEELASPMCMPEKKLGLLRTYSFTDAPIAGQNAKESWIDLLSDQYGVEGFQNEGIFIPEAYRWFYEPTAPLGGWKKQYITDTVWEKTKKGWRVTHTVGDQLFWQLEFTRGDFKGDHPDYVTYFARQPQDYVKNPLPTYILSPHEIPPTSYDTTDPVVYDSTWTPNGPVPKTLELGMVKITWAKPTLPEGMWLDLRWMDLLPESGTELPGHLIHAVPDAATKDQELAHLSRGYGECSKIER